AADVVGGGVGGGVQPRQACGVLAGLRERRVQLAGLCSDLVREHEDRGDERDHGHHHDQPDDQPQRPAVGNHHTVSVHARTGARLLFTDATTTGTVLVRSATARTPPSSAPNVVWTCLRCRITRSRPTAVIAMMSAAMITVAQATAGMLTPPSAAAAGPPSPRSGWRRRGSGARSRPSGAAAPAPAPP